MDKLICVTMKPKIHPIKKRKDELIGISDSFCDEEWMDFRRKASLYDGFENLLQPKNQSGRCVKQFVHTA